MTDFSRAHAALFDELERQGIPCADVGRLTQAVMQAQSIIATSEQPSPIPYQRCETCE